jgi:hypothetical protein
VLAAHDGTTYTTTVDARKTPGSRLEIGTTLPAGSLVRSIRLDGAPAPSDGVRDTNRGVEVTVQAKPGALHTVVVTAG